MRCDPAATLSAIRLRAIEQWSGRDGFSPPDNAQHRGGDPGLLAFGVVWPSGAGAGCHYAHGPSPSRGAAHLELLAQAGALSVSIDEADAPAGAALCGHALLKAPAPCPPANLFAPPSSSGATWPFSPGPDITSSPLSCDDPAVRPRHRGVSPFHPPR